MVTINLPSLPINPMGQADTIAELRDIPSANLENGAIVGVAGGTALGDGAGGIYFWSELTTTADNGTTVIKPDDVPPLAAGRWILLSGGYAGNGSSRVYAPDSFTEGQTFFAAPDGTSLINTPLVIVNGNTLTSDNYTWDTSGITLAEGLSLGDDIMFVIGVGIEQPTVDVDNIIGLGDADTAGKIGFESAYPTNPVPSNMQRLGDRVADLREWPIDWTGESDDTAKVLEALTQAATAGVKVVSPAGFIGLGSPVEVPIGTVLEGLSSQYMANINAPRTAFNILHTGKGFTCTGANGAREFRNIGTMRDQPTPETGWEPAALDWDFYVDGAGDVSFTNIMLLNPTKGIICTNGGGRFSLTNIWGQPLNTGIQIDTSYDRTLIDNVHFWNFWSEGLTDEAFVWDYMTREATAIYSKRNDNAIFSRLFSIFYRRLLRLGYWSGGLPGPTRKLRVYGMDADVGGSGLTVDADANGTTAQIFGYYSLGNPDTITDASAVEVKGANSDIGIYGKVSIGDAHRNATRITGSGSVLTIQNAAVAGYNIEDDGIDPAAFWTGTGAVTNFENEYNAGGGEGGAPMFGGAGRVNGAWMTHAPTITAGTGTITAYTVGDAQYRIIDNRCQIRGEFTITTNGTAAQDVRLTLPVTASATGTSAGDLSTSVPRTGSIKALAADTVAIMNLYDGTYPGGTGVTLYYNLEYRI